MHSDSHFTIASGDSEQEGKGASAGEIISLVDQSLLHYVIADQDHDPPRAQVHCEHGAVALTQLQGAHSRWQSSEAP